MVKPECLWQAAVHLLGPPMYCGRSMSTLRQTIEAQALQFATAIVQALRSASLDELVSITAGGGRAPSRAPATKTPVAAAPKVAKKAGRLGRRSPADIARTLDNIVTVLAAHPEGLRAEQIKAALSLDTREVPRPIAEGLKSGVLKKSGQKRATVYFAASSASKPKKKK